LPENLKDEIINSKKVKTEKAVKAEKKEKKE